MRYAIRLVAGVVAVLLASTALAQPPGPVSGTDLYPLKKGTKWVYKVGDNEVTVTVVGTERVNNEDCFKLETRVGREPKTTELVAVRADGVYRITANQVALNPPLKILPVPTKMGDVWTVNSIAGNRATKGVLSVVSDKEKVKTPAGEFVTVLVEGTGLEWNGVKTTVRLWFAKDRGIVKEEFTMQNGEKVTLDLSKYEEGK